MDFSLTHEQDMLVSSLRTFVEKELQPHEFAVDRADEVPPELAASDSQESHRARLLCLQHAGQSRRRGLDYLTQALVERELGRTSLGAACVRRPSEQNPDGLQRRPDRGYLKPTCAANWWTASR